MMKVLQIEAPGKAEWTDHPVPEPTDRQVLVKIEAVATCPHWDLHIMSGEPMFPGRKLSYPYPPGQPGHEAVGRVVGIGSAVTSMRPGQRVAPWIDPGKRRMGSYAQFACCEESELLEVPASLAPEKIASLELAMCVQVSFDQLVRFQAVEGKRVAVSGLGPAGLIAVQMATLCGARQVVGIDPVMERRELALKLGACEVLDPFSRNERWRHMSHHEFDTSVDATGLPESIRALMDRTRNVVTVFGVLREGVAFGFEDWSRGLALLGYGSHNRSAAERALGAVVSGGVDLSPLITRCLPLSAYADGVQALRSGGAIKVLFIP